MSIPAVDSPNGGAGLKGLWQFPTLVVAGAAFSVAVYLLWATAPKPQPVDKLQTARDFLKYDRPEAAITTLNSVLTEDDPDAATQGAVRLLLAESLETGQRLKRISLPENHAAIVEQTRLARTAGAKLSAADHKRLGDSLEALNKRQEAITAFRDAVSADPQLGASLNRKVIELLLARGEKDQAEAELEKYLHLTLTAAEKAWALGEAAELLIERKELTEARAVLGEVLKLELDDPTLRGQTAYRYGWVAYELGDRAESERQLRLARQLLTVRSPLDAEAAYLLGRIAEEAGRADEAISFYNAVLISHPGSKPYVMSRLGRGVARVLKGDDDAGLVDLTAAAQQLQRPGSAAGRQRFTDRAVEGLERAELAMTARQNYQGALELLGVEKQLMTDVPPTFWARVTGTYEKRADQVEQAAARVDGAEREALLATVRQLRIKAGDASFSHSQALTVQNDDGYGKALWNAVGLYDRAGAVQSVIAALELFTLERPSDPLTPEATLRLGKAYMAAGLFDKAIQSFQRNMFRYERSWAASASAVPLAQALIAKGGANFARAEKVLLSVVENNPALTPQASEFRNALFELATLYYRQGRYEESIARFDEVLKRYPDEERMGELLFLMGDGYRKSARLLEPAATAREARQASSAVGAGSPDLRAAATAAEADAARRQRLEQAKTLFDRVIGFYRDRPPTREIDRAQLRLAHFYRADCAFDLGLYADAIRFYEQASFRYQDDASALAAYVQIVNANVALGKLDEARTANERAKWLLKRMPPESFAEGSFALSRAYWEQWLRWSGESGLWDPTRTGQTR